MLLHHLAQRHPDQVGPYLAQTQHFCYEPPISRNQFIGKGFHRCHVF